MKAKAKILILLLMTLLMGCTRTTTPPDPDPPAIEKDYLVTYINDNKVYIKNVKSGESQIVYEPEEELDIIVPNPTMKVIAFITKTENEERKLKIYDWGKDKLFEVSSFSTEIPFVSWSDDGCYLLKYESEIGEWGNALVYDFVTQRICYELSTVGEPSWNIDSNRILTHEPQDLKDPIPFGDGDSSSVVVYDIVDNVKELILKGDNKKLYRSLKWLGHDEIAYRLFDIESGQEYIRKLNLISSEDIDITDKVNELIFTVQEVPQKFYEYQYYELTEDLKYAILCTVTELDNKIEVYDMESDEVKELADGYCASWVRWQIE